MSICLFIIQYNLHITLFSDKILNDKPEQEECPTLIDQTLIPSDTPSKMHHFEIPSQFEFLEHVESQFHCSYNKTLNTKSEQQVFQVVTDKEIILHDSPSRMHQVLSPSSF
jgi:hypothetical protein